MDEIKVFLEHAVEAIKKSYQNLEQNRVSAVNEIRTRNKAGLNEQAECLARLNA